VYEVRDKNNGTGAIVKLRVVKAESAITVQTNRLLYRFGTTAKDFGRTIAGPTNSQGMVCKPMDDVYAAGLVIAANDLFYVVDGGPCQISSAAVASSIAQHDLVTCGTDGKLDNGVASVYDFIVGRADAAITTANTASLIWVYPGLGGY
jgi:hypothetical protein